MNRIFVKPAPGLVVRDPKSLLPLPAEGKEVGASNYWYRRIAAGDVELVPSPAPAPADTPEPLPPAPDTKAAKRPRKKPRED